MTGPIHPFRLSLASTRLTLAFGAFAACLTAQDGADAHTQPLFQIEPYVVGYNDNHSAFTQMLIYDDDSLVAELQNAGASRPIVNVQVLMEDGASVESFTGSTVIDLNVRYIPIDFEVKFTRMGVFAGRTHYEIESADGVLINNFSFWVEHNEHGTSFISHKEYLKHRRALIIPLKSDPEANLEPGEVPGESTTAPGVRLCEGAIPCVK